MRVLPLFFFKLAWIVLEAGSRTYVWPWHGKFSHEFVGFCCSLHSLPSHSNPWNIRYLDGWMDGPPFWTEWNILVPKQCVFYLFIFNLWWMKTDMGMWGEEEGVSSTWWMYRSLAPVQLNPFWGWNLIPLQSRWNRSWQTKDSHCIKGWGAGIELPCFLPFI